MGTKTKIALASVLGAGLIGITGACVLSGGVLPGLAATFNFAASGTATGLEIGALAAGKLSEACAFVAPFLEGAGASAVAAYPPIG